MARSWWTWSAAGRGARRAHGGAPGAVAPGASRGGGHRARSGECLCGRRSARRCVCGATQVADRFHVLQNLRETLDEVFTTHHDALTAVNAARHQQPVPLPDGTLAVLSHRLPSPHARRTAGRPARGAATGALRARSGPSTARAAERGHCRPGGLQLSHHRAVSAPADVAGAAASPPLWTQHPQPVSGLYPGALEHRLPHRHPTVSRGSNCGATPRLSPCHRVC